MKMPKSDENTMQSTRESMESLYAKIQQLSLKNPFQPFKLEEQLGEEGEESISFERENWRTRGGTYKHRYRVRQKTKGNQEITPIRTKDFDMAFWLYFSAIVSLKEYQKRAC